jgi:hypothetical protein
VKNWYGIHTGTAFRQICERSNLYKTTLETLLESSDDDDVTDSDNSICHQKLAKLVATKRHAEAVDTALKNGSRFVDASIEDREVAREVVKDFVAFSSKKILDDIRAENDISEIYNRNSIITVAN